MKQPKMRNPKRIKRILELIEKGWLYNPNFRLMQFLFFISKRNTGDLFYIEDEELEDELNSYIDLEKGIK